MSGAPRLGAKGAANIHRNIKWLYSVLLVVVIYVKHSNGDDINSILFGFIFFSTIIVLHHVAHITALKGQENGRVLSVILASMLLFAFPIGTFIGLTLLAYNKEWKEDLNASRGSGLES